MKFSSEVIDKLKSYVYRLIDPRNGETFYVGKGIGNRVFEHANAEVKTDDDNDDLSLKLQLIREIKRAGLEVIHVIHRHGMEDGTAIEVEAALIDAYPYSTNMQGGRSNNDYGSMHITEIIRKYQAEELEIHHKIIFINVSQTAETEGLYEATRYAWRMKIDRARKSELVLATYRGLVIGAFIPERWEYATTEHFPSTTSIPTRIGFIGKEASEEIKSLYLGKRMPEEYRKRGASNPIKYSY